MAESSTNESMDGMKLPRTHGLFGWTSFTGEGFAQNALEGMQQGLHTNLNVNHHYHPSVAGGTTGSLARFGENGLALLVGRYYWNSTRHEKLAQETSPAAALLEICAQSGEECVQELSGAFSFVVVDPDKNKVILCNDHFGQFPLYYAQKDQTLVFGTSAATVLAHPYIDSELDPQGIYNYVYFHMTPSPGSVYRGVKKLQSAQMLVFDGLSFKGNRYWLPTFDESYPGNFNQHKNELRHNLNQSVERAIGNQQSTGAFLSGGLDSSTVVGMLSEVTTSQAQAFSIGFSAEGYDEMAFARITARHFDVNLHEYYVTPQDVVEALPKIATSYDEPFGNSSALPAYFCAKFAKDHGIDLLLAGDGGDELFAGNERYAKQKLFECYGLIPGWLKKAAIEPIANALADKTALTGKIKSYIDQANVPLPDRLQSYNFLHRHNSDEIFNNDFLAQIESNIPLEIQRDTYNAPNDCSQLNRMLYLDWQYTLADNDLRKVSQMCALADVDVAYPMLDQQLVEFSCKIPSKQKLKGQQLRYFYKKALQGWLPQETINKPKQGFGLPFGVWMQSHKSLQEIANYNLLSLKNRKLFNDEFLDKLVDLHRSGHASYYGELIWILTVLELWLAQ